MDNNYNIQYVYLQTIIICMYILMFTLFVTENFLIWLQPLKLTYLYLLQKNYLMYMDYFFISNRSRKC